MTGVGTAEYTINDRDYWTDDDLQKILDDRVCSGLLQAEVQLYPTVASGGGFKWVNGRVEFQGKLDVDNASVIAFNGAEISGGTTIRDDGRIEFTESQLSAIPLLSGLCYDLNGAAADVLTEWASQVKLGYDISTDGQQMTRSQRHSQLLEQAEAFRARAVIGSMRMMRGDVRPGRGRSRRTAAILRSFERWGRY